MYSLGTTGWLNNRARTRDLATQTVSALPVRDTASDLIAPAVGAVRDIPSWVLLATILLATTGICASVIAHARSQFRASSGQYQNVAADVESLRRANQSLQLEIVKLRSDDNTIEFAARERLGMVKPNDIVVPVDSLRSLTSFGTVTSVRK